MEIVLLVLLVPVSFITGLKIGEMLERSGSNNQIEKKLETIAKKEIEEFERNMENIDNYPFKQK